MGLLDAVGIAPGNNPPPAGPFERSAQYHMQAGQRRQAQRDMSAYVPIGIQRLQEIGTPQAAQAAQLLQQNPKLFFEMAKSYGGAGKWEQIMRAEAQQGQAGRLAGQAAQDAGVPADLAALYELDPATGASVHKQLYPQEKSYAGVEVYDPNSPTGTRIVPREEAMGQPGAPGTGFSITTGPDGTQRIAYGRGAGTGAGDDQAMLTKTNVTKAQANIMGLNESFDRLEEIRSNYNARSLTLPGKLEAYVAEKKDWLGLDLSSEDQQMLHRTAQMRRSVVHQAAQYVHDMTGAQSSDKEREHLMAAIPNWDDSPIVFEAKMESLMRDLESGARRNTYYINTGRVEDLVNGNALSPSRFRYLRQKRANKLYEQLKAGAPGLDDEQIQASVLNALDRELEQGVSWE